MQLICAFVFTDIKHRLSHHVAQLRDDFILKFGLHVSCIVLAVRFVIYIHVNANCLDLQARPNLNLSHNVRSKKITGEGSK